MSRTADSSLESAESRRIVVSAVDFHFRGFKGPSVRPLSVYSSLKSAAARVKSIDFLGQ